MSIPTTIATLATGTALEDLYILLQTLQLFNTNPPTVYIYCDSQVEDALKKISYTGKLYTRDSLKAYSMYTRQQMEGMPGKHFPSLWFDFMAEKINLLRWAIQECGPVLFCDADICFMAPLPTIPLHAKVALSPHMIMERDEKRFGKYNGGFAWFSSIDYAELWWAACGTARYYEQSALEDVAAHAAKDGPDALYEFPKTVNYGWWRLWQGKKSSTELLKEWGINRLKAKEASGICIEGQQLNSVHTHFRTQDIATKQFNLMVIGWLKMLAPYHVPARKLLAILQGPKAH